MNPEIKEDLMEALRSGEHVQGLTGFLEETDGTQSAFGVLCEIMDLDRHVNKFNVSYEGHIYFPPHYTLLDAGIGDEFYDLEILIDEGATFDEIADWIEVYL